ncbi:unnamed protein product [Lepeophtheirus salmonis]|uniref:(salmon louse) hypothetical protein n=1 Tax=Lepeophtheirus salmonis TaxID=72036 RepID=A0A7R8CGC9_LEPSM|nr:unnamed protein product [Lepeophtheirus salmonis]CAF2768081.1 unnamed protein product [Lepeophtheirus salmonis]
MKDYYAIESETAKNQHLLPHINLCQVYDSRLQLKVKKKCAWKYHLFKDAQKIQVCQELFLCTCALSHSKLETLRKKKLNFYGNPTLKLPINHPPRSQVFYTVEESILDPSLVSNPTIAWKYNQIFTTDYNFGVHKPKSDLWDKCMEFDVMAETSKTDSIKSEHKKHVNGKDEAANLRKLDKANNDPKTLRKNQLLQPNSYDSKNQSGIFGFLDGNHFCTTGNDLASALNHLLNNILPKYPNEDNIILYKIKSIIHRYCELRHSNIQDVDNFHSNNECALRHKEIHSPVSLVRLIK